MARYSNWVSHWYRSYSNSQQRDIFPLLEERIHASLELVRYSDKLNPAGEVSQNMSANETDMKRKRGGQKGNGNAREHGFYSGALSPAETRQIWNITNLEGVDPEIALIRVKLQSSLEHDPGNRRVIREASRLIAKWYSANYGLDATTGSYLKAVVQDLLETASLRQSSVQDSQKQMADDETNRMYFNNLIGRPTYEREHLNLGKTGDFYKTNPSQLPRVSPPAPATRKNKWQTDETNHVHVGVKRAAGNRLTYEKRAAKLRKTSHSYKTNHPGFPHALPPPSPSPAHFGAAPQVCGYLNDKRPDHDGNHELQRRHADQACRKSGAIAPG